MTVIRPNSVSGINSITVASGAALAVHKADGTLIQTIAGASGLSTFSSVSVGSATTTNNADKSINIGLGASISQHDNNTLTFGTAGDPVAKFDASGHFLPNTDSQFNIGSNSVRFANGYFDTLYGDGSNLTGLSANSISQGNSTAEILDTGTNGIFRFIPESSEVFRITHEAKVGINTNNPSHNLDISGDGVAFPSAAGSTLLRLRNSGGTATLSIDSAASGSSAIQFGDTAAASVGALIYSHVDNSIRFNAAGTGEKVRILSNGDVGINTSVINRADAGRPCIQFDYGGNDGSEGLEVRLSNSTLNGNAATDNAAITYIGQNLGITNRENGVITFRNNNLEMIRLQANKKIGLGTDSASSPVQIYGNTGTNGVTDYQTLTLQTEDRSGNADTGAGIMFLGHDGSGGAFHGTIRCNKSNSTSGNRNSYMSFATRQNGQDIKQAMRIDHTQNIFIQCSDNAGSNGRIYTNGTNEGNLTTFEINQNNGSGSEMITFRNGGTQIGQITQSGSGVAYGTSSDYRLKENDVAISDGITRIKQLRPIRFNFKNDTNTTLDGFFAHEVQSIVPESVKGEKDAVFTVEESGVGNDVAGGIKSQTLDSSRLVPLLTAALKEAITKIETLETKVAALEGG